MKKSKIWNVITIVILTVALIVTNIMNQSTIKTYKDLVALKDENICKTIEISEKNMLSAVLEYQNDYMMKTGEPCYKLDVFDIMARCDALREATMPYYNCNYKLTLK